MVDCGKCQRAAREFPPNEKWNVEEDECVVVAVMNEFARITGMRHYANGRPSQKCKIELLIALVGIFMGVYTAQV